MARRAREELDSTRCGGVSCCAIRTARACDSSRRPTAPGRSWSYPVMNESNPMKALVVEDEWPTRNYLVKLIQGTELAEVIGAVATIDEAREALTGSPIDVVFVDLHLAGTGDARTGLDLIRSIADSPGPPRVVARRKRNLIFLDPREIWAFEAADRLTFVHSRQGRFDIDLTLATIESSFGRALTRIHRNWLVNLDYVKEMEREGGDVVLFIGTEVGSEGIHAPVSRDRAKVVRDLLLENATGLRRH